MANEIHFEKIQANGNDFVLLPTLPDSAWIASLCERRHGVGADGIMIFQMRDGLVLDHFDPDGSRSLCLNGTRAALHCLFRKELISAKGTLRSNDQTFDYEVDDQIRLFLPKHHYHPLTWRMGPWEINGFMGDVGNPHFVILEELGDEELIQVAPLIRRDFDSFPDGTNVHLLHEQSDHWQIRSYERGVEGFTLACGSGMYMSALVILNERGIDQVSFQPDGKGRVHFSKRNNTLCMEGHAHWVYSGVWLCGSSSS